MLLTSWLNSLSLEAYSHVITQLSCFLFPLPHIHYRWPQGLIKSMDFLYTEKHLMLV